MQKLDQNQGRILLEVARHSIDYYLQHRRQWQPEHAGADARLLEHQACFVTLMCHGQLRGCIGSLEPSEPLLDNVAHNAVSAAFSDPRFPPLSAAEWPSVRIDLSVLGLPCPIHFENESGLLRALQPGVDGLILHTPEGRRATFLPSVWEQLPEPWEFLQHLKLKAGLPTDYWHPKMRAERYAVQYFEESMNPPHRD